MRSEISLVRGKGILFTDIILAIFFILVFWSGLALHMTRHHVFLFDWTNSAFTYIHIICSLFFLALMLLHIIAHLNWFKGLLKKGLKNRSKITILISLLFFSSITTGLFALFTDNSSIGLHHYKLSLLMMPFVLIHIMTRTPSIIKMIRKNYLSPSIK
jgi:hypothetical protein